MDQIKKSDLFDKLPKTDVYYEAQLIAAKQADEAANAGEFGGSLKIHSR
jgi:hypothetical protein